MATGKLRARQPNLTKREIDYICELVNKYKNILECKKTDSKHSKMKEETWKQLAMEYNRLPEVTQRSHVKLKMLWQNLKKRSKKMLTEKSHFNPDCEHSSNIIVPIDMESSMEKIRDMLQQPTRLPSDGEQEFPTSDANRESPIAAVPTEIIADIPTPSETVLSNNVTPLTYMSSERPVCNIEKITKVINSRIYSSISKNKEKRKSFHNVLKKLIEEYHVVQIEGLKKEQNEKLKLMQEEHEFKIKLLKLKIEVETLKKNKLLNE
ncbi:myb/SANT-like DNA-binding domain-containing protein 3 [Centruroides sculpturatus]|uniref:myb/SANT-like DNA-binding domain-containing protein 3 n=1 Tax=Centruroides sculpturatus TaxID=218467 RepID=UPI000C6D0265|nr:myb/SANT-like DNA-binding domain-containing protein 3 [Centruroides sculpturatus]